MLDITDDAEHARVEGEEVGGRVNGVFLHVRDWYADNGRLWLCTGTGCVICGTEFGNLITLLGGIKECFENLKRLLNGADGFVFATRNGQGDSVGVPIDAVSASCRSRGASSGPDRCRVS